jgi:hypothetical protein
VHPVVVGEAAYMFGGYASVTSPVEGDVYFQDGLKIDCAAGMLSLNLFLVFNFH